MGPREGLRIIEIAGIGPGPFCAMLLADMGADVVRVDRLDGGGNPLERPARSQVLHRNRRSIAADLKHPDAIAAIRQMCVSAGALLEEGAAGLP